MNYLHQLGEVITHDKYLIFFGGKKTDLIDFETHLPNKELCLLKQVHGDTLQEASVKVLEGDAHWTSSDRKLLLVQTADCLPIMVLSPQTEKILALHAGWRGVSLKIVEKAIRALNLESDPDLRVWIGPHIQQESFEVQKDVAEKILAPYSIALHDENYIRPSGERFHINLLEVIRKNLKDIGVSSERVYGSSINTRTSDHHYSYRRGDRGGRNYSFITAL